MAVKVTVAPTHIEVWLAATDTAGVMLAADMVIILLVAVGDVAQAALLVIITLTWSLFTRVVVVNVSAVCPGIVIPFTCHAYVGAAPPLVGVAVKVTLAPTQIEV